MKERSVCHRLGRISPIHSRDRRLHSAGVALTASLVFLLLAVPLLATSDASSGTHIISGPTVGRLSGSTVTVTWTTDKAKAGLVKWGNKKGQYGHKVKETQPSTSHSLTITDLGQNTTYHYKVVTGTAKSPDNEFTTANFSDAAFTFADMGDNRGPSHDTDIHSVTQSFQNILDTAVAMKPSFTVHVGDIFHGPGTPTEMTTMYGVFKTAIQPLINVSSAAPYPFTVSPGNHEMSPCHPATCTPAQLFDTYALFNQEMPNQPQNGPEGYVGTCFSFDYGNTHVASIDTCRYDKESTNSDFNFWNLTDAEINWLDQDLTTAQSNRVRHIFVFGHGQPWSPDGVEWTSATSGTQANLYGVGDMAAVGASGTILTSQDGATWTPATSGTTLTLRAVTTGTSNIVVAGDSGTILTSTDSGTTWAPSTSGTTQGLNSVLGSASLFVVAGDAGTILTSANGISWAAATSGTSQDLFGITEGTVGSQSTYVAVGASGTILTSSDGNTWTAQTSGTTRDLYSVASGIISGQTMFAAVGASGTVLTSLNGVAWTVQNSGVAADLNSVVNEFLFIAVGDAGTVLTSNDGAEWVKQSANSTADLLAVGRQGSDDLHSSLYFAAGEGGALFRSIMWMGDSSPANYQSQRDKFWQVMASHGVDAYLCGHVHTFNDDFTVDGVAQWLCGNSGSTGTGNGQWTLWSIDGDTATAQLLGESGNVAYTRVFQSKQP